MNMASVVNCIHRLTVHSHLEMLSAQELHERKQEVLIRSPRSGAAFSLIKYHVANAFHFPTIGSVTPTGLCHWGDE